MISARAREARRLAAEAREAADAADLAEAIASGCYVDPTELPAALRSQVLAAHPGTDPMATSEVFRLGGFREWSVADRGTGKHLTMARECGGGYVLSADAAPRYEPYRRG